jgi:hypothetical protein
MPSMEGAAMARVQARWPAMGARSEREGRAKGKGIGGA